jgi:hypothetical protein
MVFIFSFLVVNHPEVKSLALNCCLIMAGAE